MASESVRRARGRYITKTPFVYFCPGKVGVIPGSREGVAGGANEGGRRERESRTLQVLDNRIR